METDFDETPRFSVKEVCNLTGLSPHAIRYYDDAGLLPRVARTKGNIRLFSECDVLWLQIVHCFRAVGMPVPAVRRYVSLCLKGDSTLDERWEMVLAQEKSLLRRRAELNGQIKLLREKKSYIAERFRARREAVSDGGEIPDVPAEFPDGRRNFEKRH